MFPHHNIHTHELLLLGENNQIDHIFIDKRQHSRKANIQSFRGADCDTIIWLLQKLGDCQKT
jgi:hypothetical protein